MTTDTDRSADIAEATFTEEEARALEAMRSRYQNHHDLFSPQEIERLHFLRWRLGCSPENDLSTLHHTTLE